MPRHNIRLNSFIFLKFVAPALIKSVPSYTSTLLVLAKKLGLVLLKRNMKLKTKFECVTILFGQDFLNKGRCSTLGFFPVSRRYPRYRSVQGVVTLYKHLNSHTQTARPGTTACRQYTYLSRAGVEPVTQSDFSVDQLYTELTAQYYICTLKDTATSEFVATVTFDNRHDWQLWPNKV